MAVPHRNNATPSIARRPNDHHKSPIKPTRRNEPRLTIIAPVIRLRYSSTFEDPVSVGKVQAALA
jgi:hypothetical protein